MNTVLPAKTSSASPQRQKRRGFLLLEAVLSIALFIIFVGALGITVSRGQEGTKASGDRIRGTKITDEALEGARAIGAANFSSLTAGSHGVIFNNATGQWAFSGTSRTTTGGYVTTLTITSLSSTQRMLKAVTTWNRTPNRPQTVTMYSIFTNWKTTKTIGNWGGAALSPVGTYTYDYSAVDPAFTDIALSGNTAFLTSTNGSVPGVTIVDVTTPASPARVGTLSVGGAAYAVAVKGSVLYVITAEATKEVKAYDISTPATPVLLASYDLPGSGAANSLAVEGDFLFVGATGLGPASFVQPATHRTIADGDTILSDFFVPKALATACVDYFVDTGTGGIITLCCKTDQHVQGTSCVNNSSSSSSSVASIASSSSSSSVGAYPNGNDFFAFDISTSSQIRYLSSVYIGGVKGIALSGTSAYLASTVSSNELAVVNITNPMSMTIVGTMAGGSAQSGLAAGTQKTTLFLGVQKTAYGNGRFRMYDITNTGMPSGVIGPWDYTTSGSTVRMAADPTACYAFAATNWTPKALQVVKVNPVGSPSLLQSYTPSPVSPGVGVLHDPVNDRLYFVTSKSLFIFNPTAGSSVCP